MIRSTISFVTKHNFSSCSFFWRACVNFVSSRHLIKHVDSLSLYYKQLYLKTFEPRLNLNQIVNINWSMHGQQKLRNSKTSNCTPMSGRIDPECNLICEFPAVPQKQRVSQKRRAVVDPRPALCGPNDYPASWQTTKSIQRYEGGRHEKSLLDSIRTRYIYFHIRGYILGTCIHDHLTNVETRTSLYLYIVRSVCTWCIASSTDWRDGTLHPRHARCDTGCPARRAVDWLVQAVIGQL